MSETNPRPLHGVRVLDFSTTIAGPHCSRLLADMGADVMKIEAPEGELMRSRPVQRNGAGTMYGQLNAGKRSLGRSGERIVKQDLTARGGHDLGDPGTHLACPHDTDDHHCVRLPFSFAIRTPLSFACAAKQAEAAKRQKKGSGSCDREPPLRCDEADQPKLTATFALRRRIALPARPKPRSIMPQVAGSGILGSLLYRDGAMFTA